VGFGNLVYSQVAYTASVYHNFVVLCYVKLNHKDKQEPSREKERTGRFFCDRKAEIERKRYTGVENPYWTYSENPVMILFMLFYECHGF